MPTSSPRLSSSWEATYAEHVASGFGAFSDIRRPSECPREESWTGRKCQPVQEAQRGIRFTICGLQPGTGETESSSHQRLTVAVKPHVEVGGAIVGAILANRRKAAMAAEQPAPDGGA